jgi:hypothetical protein
VSTTPSGGVSPLTAFCAKDWSIKIDEATVMAKVQTDKKERFMPESLHRNDAKLRKAKLTAW